MMLDDKYVCKECFKDCTPIQDFIEDNLEEKECSYCRKTCEEPIAANIKKVADFIREGLETEYDMAENCLPYDSGEGGWQGTTYYTYELLREEVELDLDSEELLDDIVCLLPDQEWCDRDPYAVTQQEELTSDWERFSERTKHEVRHFQVLPESAGKPRNDIVQRPYKIIREIGEIVIQYDLISEIPEGTPIYRCRIHDSVKYATAKELGPPSNDSAIFSNRFSPAGIPMFYGAFDPDTVIAEVYDGVAKPKKIASIGSFKTCRSLLFVDLFKLPPFPSVFDGLSIRERDLLRFLHHFTRRCTMPIRKDGREHIEYVPTQVITEYFRHVFRGPKKEKIDGLIYPSALKEGGICCVIFCRNQDCTDDNKPIVTLFGKKKPVLSLDSRDFIYRKLP